MGLQTTSQQGIPIDLYKLIFKSTWKSHRHCISKADLKIKEAKCPTRHQDLSQAIVI